VNDGGDGGDGVTPHDWKPVKDFEGYVISRHAEVWSTGRTVSTKRGATRVTAAKQLKPDDKNRVALRRDGKTHKLNVHQLAADAFPPAPLHLVALGHPDVQLVRS
jgi:hypothetical protein